MRKKNKGLIPLILWVLGILLACVAMGLLLRETPDKTMRAYLNASMRADVDEVMRHIPEPVIEYYAKQAVSSDKIAQEEAYRAYVQEKLENSDRILSYDIQKIEKAESMDLELTRKSYEELGLQVSQMRKCTVTLTVQTTQGQEKTYDAYYRVVKIGIWWYVVFGGI